MTGGLAGKVGVVTGGGNGIGAAVARRLAAAGASVVIVDRDSAAARAVATAVGGTAVRADLAVPDGSRMAFARAEAIHGRIDLLHLNAGALSGTPDVTQVNADHYRSVTGINIDAVFFGVQAAVPALTRAGGGSILVTSSIAGLTAFDLDPVYAMTKHAVIGLVRALAGTLSRQGIRISAICPDFVDTGFFGTHRQMLAGAGFQMLTAEEVAEAAVAELTDGAAGRLLVVRHGRPPAEHVFAAVD